MRIWKRKTLQVISFGQRWIAGLAITTGGMPLRAWLDLIFTINIVLPKRPLTILLFNCVTLLTVDRENYHLEHTRSCAVRTPCVWILRQLRHAPHGTGETSCTSQFLPLRVFGTKAVRYSPFGLRELELTQTKICGSVTGHYGFPPVAELDHFSPFLLFCAFCGFLSGDVALVASSRNPHRISFISIVFFTPHLDTSINPFIRARYK